MLAPYRLHGGEPEINSSLPADVMEIGFFLIQSRQATEIKFLILKENLY